MKGKDYDINLVRFSMYKCVVEVMEVFSKKKMLRLYSDLSSNLGIYN